MLEYIAVEAISEEERLFSVLDRRSEHESEAVLEFNRCCSLTEKTLEMSASQVHPSTKGELDLHPLEFFVYSHSIIQKFERRGKSSACSST